MSVKIKLYIYFYIYTFHNRLKIHRSVHAIENWWIRMKNRRVFKVLKDAICAAVSSTKVTTVCNCDSKREGRGI